MKYKATPDTLTLECDESERAALRALWEDYQEFPSIEESLFLEPLIANSELDWINPAETGDLTDAPILGILGPDVPGCETEGWTWQSEAHPGLNLRPMAWRETGRDEKTKYFQPILQRWGFMPYQVRSFLSDLMETGKAVFVSSH